MIATIIFGLTIAISSAYINHNQWLNVRNVPASLFDKGADTRWHWFLWIQWAFIYYTNAALTYPDYPIEFFQVMALYSVLHWIVFELWLYRLNAHSILHMGKNWPDTWFSPLGDAGPILKFVLKIALLVTTLLWYLL